MGAMNVSVEGAALRMVVQMRPKLNAESAQAQHYRSTQSESPSDSEENRNTQAARSDHASVVTRIAQHTFRTGFCDRTNWYGLPEHDEEGPKVKDTSARRLT